MTQLVNFCALSACLSRIFRVPIELIGLPRIVAALHAAQLADEIVYGVVSNLIPLCRRPPHVLSLLLQHPHVPPYLIQMGVSLEEFRRRSPHDAGHAGFVRRQSELVAALGEILPVELRKQP